LALFPFKLKSEFLLKHCEEGRAEDRSMAPGESARENSLGEVSIWRDLVRAVFIRLN
jgi:hypothetical protein